MTILYIEIIVLIFISIKMNKLKLLLIGLGLTSAIHAETLSLTTGWNLIGVNSSLSLNELKIKVGQDNLLVIQGQKKTYQKSYLDDEKDFLNDFTVFEEGRGYWIKVASSIDIEYDEITYTTEQTIKLFAGWNIINPPINMSLNDIKTQLGDKLEVIQGVVKTYQKSYVDNSQDLLNNFQNFEKSKGYWVKVTIDSILSFPVSAVAPTKPTLSSTLPLTTTADTQSIEVNGEVGTTVWVNGISVETIGENGKVTISLDTSGVDGTKSFSIVLKDVYNNSSEALVLNIIKTTANDTRVIYEDAEDANTIGWHVNYSHSGESAIDNEYDTDIESRVITFKSGSMYDSYRFSFPSEDSKNSILKFSTKFDDDIYGFEILVKTKNGKRVIRYVGKDTGNGSNGKTILHGLGSDAVDGEWHTYVRDLSSDIKRYEPNNEWISTYGCNFYGSGSIDDIELYEKKMGLDIGTAIEVSAPGIVFTFDDSLIDDWYRMKDTFREKSVVVTFFCHRWATLSPNEIAKFKDLEEDGHEIGFHTVDHLHTKDKRYDNIENKAQAYFNEQIIPGLNAMRNDDFEPTSFSYPFISGQPKHSELIKTELPHIREFFSSVVQIDNAANRSIEEIKKELLRLKNNKDIGVFLAHRILPEANPDTYKYRIPTEKLIEIIDEVNRLGLQFYTMEEAHRIYLNQ